MVDFHCCCYKTYYIQSQERMPWTRLKGVRIAHSKRAQKGEINNIQGNQGPSQCTAINCFPSTEWMTERKMWTLSEEILLSLSCGPYLTCAENFCTWIRSLFLLPTSSLPYLCLIFRYCPSLLLFSTLTTIAPVFFVALDDPPLWS